MALSPSTAVLPLTCTTHMAAQLMLACSSTAWASAGAVRAMVINTVTEVLQLPLRVDAMGAVAAVINVQAAAFTGLGHGEVIPVGGWETTVLQPKLAGRRSSGRVVRRSGVRPWPSAEPPGGTVRGSSAQRAVQMAGIPCLELCEKPIASNSPKHRFTRTLAIDQAATFIRQWGSDRYRNHPARTSKPRGMAEP